MQWELLLDLQVAQRSHVQSACNNGYLLYDGIQRLGIGNGCTFRELVYTNMKISLAVCVKLVSHT